MEIRRGFYDLCVPYVKKPAELEATLSELYDVGYRTVAIEQIFDHTKAVRKTNEVFPEPFDLSELRKKFDQKLHILSRLTIMYAQQVVSHDMNTSLNLKKFHLVAALPMNEGALQHACSTFVGDIIAMVVEDSKYCLIGHKYYQMAARRGMHFEIQYAPAIRDSNQRKDTIVVAQNLVSHRKAKCIVITSGALNAFQVRSPYDIANLGLIFGLSEEQSKSSILHICRTILLKAEGRRHGKTVIFAKNVPRKHIEEENNIEESDYGEESDSDESMSDGHPTKKQKTS